MKKVILATAGYDNCIKFWDPSDGSCTRNIPYPDSHCNRLVISPNRSVIASAGFCNLKLFDLNSTASNPIQNFDDHTGNVTAVGFEKDCKWIYSGSEDKTIRIWDYRAQGFQRQFDGNSFVNSVILHPNQAELISGDQNGIVSIWDLTMNKCRFQLEPCPGEEIGIRSITMTEDASLLAVGNSRGFCYIWTHKNGEDLTEMQQIQSNDQYILKNQFSPSGNTLAICSSDHSIKLFKLSNSENEDEEFKEYKVLFGHNKFVWDCTFSSDSALLISVSTDTVAKIWDVESGSLIKNLNGHTRGLTCVALNDSED